MFRIALANIRFPATPEASVTLAQQAIVAAGTEHADLICFPTTSAIVRPDGTLLCYQPYGKEGLLVADIDITAATGLLASRYRG